MKIPIVTFVGALRDPGAPRVSMEHAAIGESAAEHLLMRGFREFAFYGIEQASFSEHRQAAFESMLKEHGITPRIYLSRTTFYEQEKSWDNEITSLSEWVAGLPKPVGVFAANDQRARILADACVVGNARVPEDVAIVGVDNDELLCEFGSPTLTSVACDWHKLGYETAALLDGLMRGKSAPARDRIIPPIGVIGRESTTAMVSSDPDVARAIAFANQHSCEIFGVGALVKAAGVSRRRLEMAFGESFGCSPMTFLARFRTEKAKMLLQKKGILLSKVAQDCGFANLRHFRQAFTRVAQMSPREYQESILSTYKNKDSIF
jgi:LacI family transcriptional regulator